MKPRIYKEAGQWWLVELPRRGKANRFNIVRFRTWDETIRFTMEFVRQIAKESGPKLSLIIQ